MVQMPVNPLAILPLRQVWRLEIRFSAFGVVPGHDATHVVDNRVGADRGRLGAGSVEVGDVIHVAVGIVAPTVIRAAYRVALDLLAILDDHGAFAGRQVSTHVGTIGIQQDRPAALAAIQGHVLAEKANSLGAFVQFAAFSHDEPPARVCIGPQVVVGSFGHSQSPRNS